MVAFYTKSIILPRENSPSLLKVGNWWLLDIVSLCCHLCCLNLHLGKLFLANLEVPNLTRNSMVLPSGDSNYCKFLLILLEKGWQVCLYSNNAIYILFWLNLSYLFLKLLIEVILTASNGVLLQVIRTQFSQTFYQNVFIKGNHNLSNYEYKFLTNIIDFEIISKTNIINLTNISY